MGIMSAVIADTFTFRIRGQNTIIKCVFHAENSYAFTGVFQTVNGFIDVLDLSVTVCYCIHMRFNAALGTLFCRNIAVVLGQRFD